MASQSQRKHFTLALTTICFILTSQCFAFAYSASLQDGSVADLNVPLPGTQEDTVFVEGKFYKTCNGGYINENNICVPYTPPGCPAKHVLINGLCYLNDPTPKLICPNGYYLANNMCYATPSCYTSTTARPDIATEAATTSVEMVKSTPATTTVTNSPIITTTPVSSSASSTTSTTTTTTMLTSSIPLSTTTTTSTPSSIPLSTTTTTSTPSSIPISTTTAISTTTPSSTPILKTTTTSTTTPQMTTSTTSTTAPTPTTSTIFNTTTSAASSTTTASPVIPPPPPPPDAFTRCPEGSLFDEGMCRKIYCTKGEYLLGRCLQPLCPAPTVWHAGTHSCQEPSYITTILEIDNIFVQDSQDKPGVTAQSVQNNIYYYTTKSELMQTDGAISEPTPSSITATTESAIIVNSTTSTKQSSTENPMHNGTAAGCCSIITPRICKRYGQKWVCFNRRYMRCDMNICHSPIIYLRPPQVTYKPPMLIMPPNPPLQACASENCEATDAVDCSGCAHNQRDKCSTYCYRYMCPYNGCAFMDQQLYCERYPGEPGCTKEDGCLWDWCGENCS